MNCMFFKPVGNLSTRHLTRYHWYANDIQIDFDIESNEDWTGENTFQCLSCGHKIMDVHQSYTIKPTTYLRESFAFRIGESSFIKNLDGFFVDRMLSMKKNCSTIVRICFNNIRKIGRICPFITDNACKNLINSLMTSRHNYENTLMHGINKFVKKLRKKRKKLPHG
jgi:hypothetical protein